MAVCHVGENWVVQSLCMGSVYLALQALLCCGLPSLEDEHTTHAQRQRLHQWVRRYIPRAVETPEQQRLVLYDD